MSVVLSRAPDRYYPGEEDSFGKWRGYRARNTRRGVIFCGGVGTSAASAFNLTYGPTNRLLSEWHPLAGADLGGVGTWGNDLVRSRVLALHDYLIDRGAADEPMFMVGQSMGTLSTLSFYLAHPELVRAVAISLPLPDLAYEHDNNVAGFAAQIETAYGGLAGYNAAIASHDPMQNTAAYSDLPIKFFYNDADTIAPTARALAFAAAVGPNVELQSLGAGNHTSVNLNPQDVLDFLWEHES